MTNNEESVDQQQSDLVQIHEPQEIYPILIDAQQLNRYFHTLLGHPFQRLKFFSNDNDQQYHFYRTPGIFKYLITYYLHQGCLSTETSFPPEILYDELIFFRFNIQVIYEIISNLITREYFIPSGQWRRAFWEILNDEYPETPTRIALGLIYLSSVINSLSLIELINFIDQQNKVIHRILVTEMIIGSFSLIEFFLRYFIRRKFPWTNWFFALIQSASCLPFSLFLFIQPRAPLWLYSFLVIQLASRILRCVCLSSSAFELVRIISNQSSICFLSFQSIISLVLFFALLMLALEQISQPVEFLINSTTIITRRDQPISEILWIAFNAFTSVGEGTSRPSTGVGLGIEFLICFIGIMIIPQLVQSIYGIVSENIDQQRSNAQKGPRLLIIIDEFGHRAIGQIDCLGDLPEILIDQDEIESFKTT